MVDIEVRKREGSKTVPRFLRIKTANISGYIIQTCMATVTIFFRYSWNVLIVKYKSLKIHLNIILSCYFDPNKHNKEKICFFSKLSNTELLKRCPTGP